MLAQQGQDTRTPPREERRATVRALLTAGAVLTSPWAYVGLYMPWTPVLGGSGLAGRSRWAAPQIATLAASDVLRLADLRRARFPHFAKHADRFTLTDDRRPEMLTRLGHDSRTST